MFDNSIERYQVLMLFLFRISKVFLLLLCLNVCSVFCLLYSLGCSLLVWYMNVFLFPLYLDDMIWMSLLPEWQTSNIQHVACFQIENQKLEGALGQLTSQMINGSNYFTGTLSGNVISHQTLTLLSGASQISLTPGMTALSIVFSFLLDVSCSLGGGVNSFKWSPFVCSHELL